MQPVPMLDAEALIARYEVFFLDAYGVLNDAHQAFPGAADFLAAIRRAGKRFCILSNDASRSIESTFSRYRGFGLDVDRDAIVTSGSLLAEHFRAQGLVGRRCLVLGTADAQGYVSEAGGVVAPLDDESAEVLVVADDDGFPFLEGMNAVITVLLRRLSRGQPMALLVPNPDLVFPTAKGGFGLTAGAMASMLEDILRLRIPDGRHRFVALGKPNPPIFEAGMRKLGLRDRKGIVMVGDQLVTDIRGANRFGIDAALVLTGISSMDDIARFEERPTWVLPRL